MTGTLRAIWEIRLLLGQSLAKTSHTHTSTHSSEAAPCKVMAIPVCSQLKSSPSQCSASRIQNVDLSQEEDQKQGLKDLKGEVMWARYGGDLTTARNFGGFLAHRMTADVKLSHQLSQTPARWLVTYGAQRRGLQEKQTHKDQGNSDPPKGHSPDDSKLKTQIIPAFGPPDL